MVRLDSDGRVTAVLCGQLNTRRNDWANGESIEPVVDVVDALHNGAAVFALFPAEHGHLPERLEVSRGFATSRWPEMRDFIRVYWENRVLSSAAHRWIRKQGLS